MGGGGEGGIISNGTAHFCLGWGGGLLAQFPSVGNQMFVPRVLSESRVNGNWKKQHIPITIMHLHNISVAVSLKWHKHSRQPEQKWLPVPWQKQTNSKEDYDNKDNMQIWISWQLSHSDDHNSYLQNTCFGGTAIVKPVYYWSKGHNFSLFKYCLVQIWATKRHAESCVLYYTSRVINIHL